MEIQITEKKDNPLLDRTDVHFTVLHPNAKTPTRDQVRSALAKAIAATPENTVIERVTSEFGRGSSTGFAKVYKDLAKARHHERNYIQKRNGILVEPKKEKA